MTKNRMIQKDFIIKSTKVDTEKREISVVITDASVDRDKEVLLPEGLNHSNFKKNGIILFNHNRDFPLGTAISLRRKDDSWVAKGKFAEEGTSPEIDKIWSLIDQGIIKAVSIGFIEHEGRIPTDPDKKRFGKEVNWVITKFELIEFSIVSVGSNPNALIRASKSLDLDPKIIFGEDYKEEIEEMIEEEKLEEDKEKLEKMIKEDIKELEEKEDIEIKPEIKKKIIKIVKEKKIDIKKVMKYFIDETKESIKKSKGQLF